MQRRQLLATAGALSLSPFAGRPALAQSFPSQPVRFVVPYSPGGLPDTVARVVARKLTERIGQSVVVENRPGANGVVAAQVITGANPDGHTLLLTDDSMMTINPLIYKDIAYVPKRDFLPVSLIATAPLFLAAHPSFPANTFQEMVALVKSRPGEFTYGSSGVGSTHHLCMEALKAALGLEIRHVPFKGTGQSVPAVVGNQVPMVFSAFPSLAGFVKDNRVKLLVVNTAKRSQFAPNLTALGEIIPGFDFAPNIGIFAPARTPSAVVTRLSDEVARLVKDADVIQTFTAAGIEAIGGSPADYTRVLEREAERDARAVKAAGLKAE
ncbi:MAG: tripartite tricarboxylate transporter substrate binding protein [Burkholderiales bacterium]|nr:tripartite tricarboxylate transporter substrate binding protein [Burkholderiales bacterium]